MITVLLLSLHLLPASAQTDVTGTITRQFDKHKEQLLQEKIFVHTDRSFYVAGEIIWFKMYCVNEDNNQLLNLSKVAYVEVLNKDRQPVLQAKIELKDGKGNGSLALPADMHSGNYVFRAYTNWMKNAAPEFYFHQDLTIVNTVRADSVSLAAAEENYDVQFFPEGGELVNELSSKVAFRVTDNSGKGIGFTGIVTSDNNDTMVRFAPARFGIGNFTFTPQKNRQYKATVTTAGGKVVTKNLPAAAGGGFTIHLSDKEDRLQIAVQTNTNSRLSYLFVHTRQQVITSQVVYFTDGKATVELDKSKLGEGISHITLFDINQEPVCERLYFKRPQQQLLLSGKADQQEYMPRKKVTIDLATENGSSQPLPAELSMAVFVVDSLPYTYNDIYSYLWLSSDLKGKVESPEYYVNNQSSEANEALDNLMLTHGWRRFNWTDALHDKKPALTFLPEYEGHIVSGKIVNTQHESPAERTLAFLSVPGSHFKLYNSLSSTDGTVHFNTKDFYGNRLMVAKVYSADTIPYRVDLANPFSESFSAEKIPAFNASITAPSALLKRSVNMQVQNVYSGTKLQVFEKAKTDTFNFYVKPETTYLLDDYTRFASMEEVLTEYVPEISIRKRSNRFSLRMLNKDEDGNAIIKEPVVLLDGLPQFDLGNQISHHNPLKVERLETINRSYFLGSARFDGIASFFSYNGDLAGFQLDSSSTVVDYEALQLRRQFYHPQYQTTEQFASRLPDYRNLLYWSPEITTDSQGKKQVSFYTSDLAGKYAVVVQGISQQGKTGSTTFVIDVKRDPLLTK